MKITRIEHESTGAGRFRVDYYTVHLEPTRVERIFGAKPRVQSFKRDGPFYYSEDGSWLDPHSDIAYEIDRYQHKWTRK